MGEKIRHILGNVYMKIACIAIACVILLTNIFHIFSVNNAKEFLFNIFFVTIIVAFFILLNKFIISKIDDKKSKIILFIGLVIFLLLEILSIVFFKVKYNWDFRWLMESAIDIVEKGTTENIYYFKIFPNNLAALIAVTVAIKLFNSVTGAYVLSSVSVFLAGLFTILVSKKIGGNKVAINALILLIGCMPLYLNTPIVYTDTLSVALPIAIIYFWILAKENKEKSKKKYYVYLVIVSILSVIGYYMKATVFIVTIAIILDTIFCNKKIIKPLVITGSIFIILYMSFSKVTYQFLLKDTKKNNFEYPLTHWLMMGLELPESEGGTSIGYGAYSQSDADYTAIQPTYQDKQKANIVKIKERLKNFGIIGYGKFLLKKFRYVWNDGTYYVLSVIGWDTINQNSTLYRLVIGDLSNQFVRPYMKYFNNALFVFILYAIYDDIKNKKNNDIIRVIGITIVGIAMFLLIWEARSRYIYLIIPLFIVLGAQGISKFYEMLDTKGVKKLEEHKMEAKK